MIVLYILGGIAALIAVILLLPVGVNLNYSDEFDFKVKVAFITVPLAKEKEKKPKLNKENPKEQTVRSGKENKNFFMKLKEKKGFAGAIKEIFSLIKDALTPLKLFLRFVRLRNVKLSVSVVGEDAAKTAIDYGVVCSAVYPTLSFLDTFSNIQYKSVDVKADFEAKKSKLSFSMKMRTNVIFILIFVFRLYNEYEKFSERNGL